MQIHLFLFSILSLQKDNIIYTLSCTLFFHLVARTAGTMLNSSGESRHLCLVPDLKRKGSNLSQLNTMLATGFL